MHYMSHVLSKLRSIDFYLVWIWREFFYTFFVPILIFSRQETTMSHPVSIQIYLNRKSQKKKFLFFRLCMVSTLNTSVPVLLVQCNVKMVLYGKMILCVMSQSLFVVNVVNGQWSFFKAETIYSLSDLAFKADRNFT